MSKSGAIVTHAPHPKQEGESHGLCGVKGRGVMLSQNVSCKRCQARL